MMAPMLDRHITDRVLEALADTPVVLLHGPRQCGKSTLVQHIARNHHPARYITLDEVIPRVAAQADPETFIAELGGAAVIDEVQLVPELFMAVKASVDRDRRPGRLLLTGSADVTLLPDIAESLAGRVERLTLWPFSQAEIAGLRGNLLDHLFRSSVPHVSSDLTRQDYLELATRGGYPEAVARPAGRRRARWFASYLDTMIQRDVRRLANIEGTVDLPRLLMALADRATGLLNYTDLGRDLGMNRFTVKRYITLLQTAFLIAELPAWHRNVGKRLRKTPKVIFPDSGLLAHLLGADEPSSVTAGRRVGPLVESMVIAEVRKLQTWAEVDAAAFHFRAEDGAEVDLVLEARGGRMVAVEVKAAATLDARDLRGLRHLQELVGDDLVCGVILHAGRETVAFGERLHALPISALWAPVAPPA